MYLLVVAKTTKDARYIHYNTCVLLPLVDKPYASVRTQILVPHMKTTTESVCKLGSSVYLDLSKFILRVNRGFGELICAKIQITVLSVARILHTQFMRGSLNTSKR